MKSVVMKSLLLLLAFCFTQLEAANLKVSKKSYGRTAAGEKVHEFTLQNGNGITVKLINYGATLTSLVTPDRDGKLADIVLGYDDIRGYESDPIFSGCVVGRFANRISNASFELEGKQYPLAANFEGGHHLHRNRSRHRNASRRKQGQRGSRAQDTACRVSPLLDRSPR